MLLRELATHAVGIQREGARNIRDLQQRSRLGALLQIADAMHAASEQSCVILGGTNLFKRTSVPPVLRACATSAWLLQLRRHTIEPPMLLIGSRQYCGNLVAAEGIEGRGEAPHETPTRLCQQFDCIIDPCNSRFSLVTA